MSIRVAILGPTGYTGYWLIELLLRHSGAKLTYLASRREQPPNIVEEFPALLGRCDLSCRPIDVDAIAAEADLVFAALPHKAAMAQVPKLLGTGLRVVDLSADYRLRDADLYEQTYKTPHEDKANLADAVYGLPELYAEQIASADLVANPGCYPTTAALGLIPLLQRGLVDTGDVVVSAASGVTGAGRSPKPHLHFPEVHDGFFAYACGNHRHQPEMAQLLSEAAGSPIEPLFVPHMLPIDRGILASTYADPVSEDVTEEDLYEALESAYAEEPFIRVRPELPNVKHVRDTNFCDIGVRLTDQGDGGKKVAVFTALDNMIKGASGQAIHNMNLMFGQEPSEGLL